ncbi:hypothetical protein LWX53_04280 [bacterium]|nr:hypothetical protein [bacterium]
MIRFLRGRERPAAGRRGPYRLAPIAAIALIAAATTPCGRLGAQPFVKDLNSLGTAVLFGTPSREQSGFNYLQTGALTNSPSGAVLAVEAGTVLFVKRASSFEMQRFGGAGEFVALAHDDGFVSLYTGKTLIVARMPSSGRIGASDSVGRVSAEGRGELAQYIVRLYDGSSGVWINPALFAGALDDKIPPKIEQIALQGSGGLFFAEGGGAARRSAKSAVQKIPQGEYALAVSVSDASSGKNPVSGVFRMKVLFNGTVAFDKKFDAARAAEGGLSFLGLDVPSANCLDREGRIVLGRQFIPRGQNTLDLTVFDFAGNSARYVWSFATE